MVKAKLYYNSGFTLMNVPKDLETLTKASQKVTELPVMDIVQMYGLKNIILKAKEEDLYNVDYIELYKTYEGGTQRVFYVVDYNNITFTSMDVANVPVTIEPYLSLIYSGPEIITRAVGAFLKRSNKLNPCDTLSNTKSHYINGKVMVDDLLVPMGAPNVRYFYANDFYDRKSANRYMVKSCVDLKKLLEMEADVFEYKYTETGVAVPELPSLSGNTTFHINQILSQGGQLSYTDTSGPWQFIPDSMELGKIMSRLVSFGATDAILDSYVLPGYTIQNIEIANDSYLVKNIYPVEDVAIDFDIFKWLGIDADGDEDTAMRRYMMMSMETKIGIITASGEHDETTPAEFGAMGHLVVHICYDIQRHGAPYYIINKPNWDILEPETDDTFKTVKISRALLPHACKGMEWQDAAISTIGIRGGAINREKFDTEVTYKDFMALPDVKAATEGGVMNYAKSLFSQGVANYFNPGDELGSYVTQSFMGDPGQFNRYLEKQKELSDYRLSVKVPETHVNGTMSYTMRNYFGNGVFIYIKTQAPLKNDARFVYYKQLLQRFGFKTLRQATEDDLLKIADGKKFLYVEADNIEFGTSKLRGVFPNCPKSLLENLQDAFSIGFRIWNQRPE